MLIHAMLMNQSIIACLSLNRLRGGNTVQNDEFLFRGITITISPSTCSSWIARKFRHWNFRVRQICSMHRLRISFSICTCKNEISQKCFGSRLSRETRWKAQLMNIYLSLLFPVCLWRLPNDSPTNLNHMSCGICGKGKLRDATISGSSNLSFSRRSVT